MNRAGLPLRRITIGILAITLLIALALTLWLRMHPESVRTVLNAYLPPTIRLVEVRGLHASAAGGRMEHLRLELSGTVLTIEDVRWRWGIASLYPPRIAPRAVRVGRLDIRLAQSHSPATGTEPLLPRFWTAAWWPSIARIDLEIEGLRLIGHDGSEVMAGSFVSNDGGNIGNARFDIPQWGPMQLRWQSLDDIPHSRGWRIDWRSDALAQAQAQAVLELRADPVPGTLAWKLHASMRPPASLSGGHSLQLTASGSANPFDATAALLTGQLDLQATLETPAGTARIGCATTLSAAQSLAAVITLEECTGHIGDGKLTLQMPLLMTLDATATPLLLLTTGGSLHVDGPSIDTWQLRKLHLAAPAATLWQAGTPMPATPQGRLTIELVNAAQDIQLHLDSSIAVASIGAAHPTVTLQGELQARHDRQRLRALELQTSLTVDDGALESSGTLAYAALGQLLGWQIGHSGSSGSLHGELSLDSHDWHWGEGLLHTLLDPHQTLFEGDLRTGELQVKLRLDGHMDKPRARITASIHGLGGTIGNTAFIGLECGALRLDWQDSRLRLREDLHCRAQSANAGITIDTPHASLRQVGESWQLHDIGAELLGGSVSIEQADIGADGTIRAVAKLRGIDLGSVAALLDEPALTLTGKLDGDLPLALEGGVPILRTGKVHSTGAGVIRYRPASVPEGESSELALTRKALSNLEFDSLQAALDYRSNGMLLIDAAIRGRNPDLDPKRPVHLNLTLETNLRTLMRSLSAGDRINAWLERHL